MKPHNIHYDVRFNTPETHLFELECHIAHPAVEGQRVSLPAWLPGSYLVRDFARHIVSIRATSNGKAIKLEKIDKSSWQAGPCTSPLTIHYQVYAYDLSVRTAYLDHARAYFNGSSVFLQVTGQEESSCSVTIHHPAGKTYADWQVATTLPGRKTDKQGFGLYEAAHYQALIDYPVEIGTLAIAEFKAMGIPHRLVISGKHQADLKAISRDLKKICEHHIRFFGDAPFQRYDFLLYAAADNQYGGLEHCDSTSLICPRSWLPVKHEEHDPSLYQDFLGLCSHEYFHAWHVKRIRPVAFAKPDLSREAYTRLLWVFEGFTAYYDTLALVRSGLMTESEYLAALSKDINRFLRTPGRRIQALEESSFDAWVKLYKPDENTPNSQISYYLKGSLVALAMDLSLRLKQRSLDDVMRTLWQRYRNHEQLVNEGSMQALIAEVCGEKLASLFRDCVQGCEDPPLEKLLSRFGIIFTADKINDADLLREHLGLQLANDETRITHVFSNGAAEQAGLAAGDVIIAHDHLKASAKSLKQQLKRHRKQLHLHFFRRDELLSTDIFPRKHALAHYRLAISEKQKPEQRTLRQDWLATN
ncbi:Predicted metalloprotease, contains C-terminal PDZ domain [Methylobacillus rhizosphaerae]|uniref:Predicted metalloprotease, contains C-terminal PDZ domain n=1 Tax=Methylobacillus rhizosphaerae TaxID=551994 RepID=A0A239APS1_9PROT|nr:PDZ domain-containing protein [Methylobacillus rhizosphaerae]SNR97706.1 Predicted metalloprotease, contains C-terminal PDZ domain [Methylobacillus rhizosphaerae]